MPYFMDRLPRFDNAAQTNTMRSNIIFKSNGITPDKMRKCFNFSMDRSTCDLKAATRRVWVTAFDESLGPRQYAGEISWIFLKASESRTKKPLSAITASPSSK